ncbi:MAG: TetR/AcrR family transcriptional regulator [Myxococcota bacterium]
MVAVARDSKLKVRAPSQQRGTETMEALRKAAQQALRTRDFSRVSVSELAKAAGVGVGTFYHFYPSKESLLLDLRQQLFERSAETLAQAFQSPIADGQGLKAALHSLIKGWIRISVEQRGLERAIAALSFESEPFARALREQEERITEMVQGLLEAHASTLRPLDPAPAARALVILVDALVARAMREPELAENHDAVVHEVARMIGRYLLPPSGER